MLNKFIVTCERHSYLNRSRISRFDVLLSSILSATKNQALETMSTQSHQSRSPNTSPRHARSGQRHSLTISQLLWIQNRNEELELSHTGNTLTSAFNERFGTRLFVADLMHAIAPYADEEGREMLDGISERAAERSRRAEAAMDEALGVGARESDFALDIRIGGRNEVEIEIASEGGVDVEIGIESGAARAGEVATHQERRRNSAPSSVPPAYGDIPGSLTIPQVAWLSAVASSLGRPGSLPLMAMTPEFNRRFDTSWKELDLLRAALPYVSEAVGELIILYMMHVPDDTQSTAQAEASASVGREFEPSQGSSQGPSQTSSQVSSRASSHVPSQIRRSLSPPSSNPSHASSPTLVNRRTASEETLRAAQPIPPHNPLSIRPSAMFNQHSYLTYEQLWWLRDMCDSVNLSHSEALSVLNRFQLKFGTGYSSGELMMRLVNTVRRDVSCWEGISSAPDFDRVVREIDSVVLESEDEREVEERLGSLVRSCFQGMRVSGSVNMG